MNSENTKLIEQLAESIGTTAEYLWSVLLSQAHVYAITTSIEIIGVILIGVVLIYCHKKFSKESDEYDSVYDSSEGFLQAVMIIISFIWAVLFIIAFFSISSIITAIVNPEYWALDKLLDTISK